MLDSGGRVVSSEMATLLAWVEEWIEAELGRGESLASAVQRFNDASPIIISLFSAMQASGDAERQLEALV